LMFLMRNLGELTFILCNSFVK